MWVVDTFASSGDGSLWCIPKKSNADKSSVAAVAGSKESDNAVALTMVCVSVVGAFAATWVGGYDATVEMVLSPSTGLAADADGSIASVALDRHLGD